jgi:NAD(P)-dependent dehydrogenase (short-subunit alcohol dehydrogenase family)
VSPSTFRSAPSLNHYLTILYSPSLSAFKILPSRSHNKMASNATKYTSKLAGKRVLVIGGTSGIGFAVAEASVEFGANVIVSGSNPERLQRTIERLQNAYPAAAGQITGFTCNLADADNLEANLDTLLKNASSGGKIDHIAFTAGDAIVSPPLKDMDVKAMWNGGIVRCVGVLILAKLIPTYMDLTPGSSLTITGGTNTDKPMPGRVMMAAWGGAIEGLMRGLAVDLKPMRVNMVSPGGTHTELFDRFGAQKENFLEMMKAQTTVGEVGRPEEVAEAYIYSMRDRFASGAIINTNGGRLLA